MEILKLLQNLIANAVAPSVFIDANDDIVGIRKADGSIAIEDVRKFRRDPPPPPRAGSVMLQGTQSFKSYIEDHGADHEASDHRTVMFVNPNQQRDGDTFVIGTAVLDYHVDLVGSAHLRNTAVLTLKQHPLYNLVKPLFKMQSQSDFAQTLRRVGSVFTGPSPSEMLTVAQTLKIHSASSFQSVSDPGSGSVDFVFQKQNTGSAGGYGEHAITVPDVVNLKVPMFVGSQPLDIQCRFEYRPPSSAGGQIEMRLAYDNEAIDTYNAVEGVIAELEEFGLQCLRGTYQNGAAG